MSKVIGIDLGTTNSVVSVLEGGEPTVITNPEGSRITPSVVGFTKDGQRLVGQLAKRQAVSNPDRTIASIKRHMGEQYKVTIDGKDYTDIKTTPNEYTITFDSDGGSAIEAITQIVGTEVTAPADPTKAGYTFGGWNPEVPAVMPAENLTVKATWNLVEYKIEYVLNGGVNAASNPATTRYPGNGEGCDTPDALKRTSLVIGGAAHVELTDSARAVNLSIETGSTIDLAGNTLTVRLATLGGAKLPSGTYTAGDSAIDGFVTDSGEGGSLIVAGGATVFIVN